MLSKALLRSHVETALLSPVRAFQYARTHHGREGQRNHSGHEDSHAQGDGELAEKPANDVAHEEQRNQHGNQRDGQRYDGETDLLRAFEGRFQRRISLFDEANDVLDHDDGVIDDEARGNREGHQREVV